ncbi:fungal-specific transcription factor domain-domain-containing protein, partial [Naematelia encephala]
RSGRAGVKRRQKYQRTRTGCLSCRARRIKCDEEHPVCRRCTIAKKTCHYPDEESAEGGSRRGSKDGLGHGSRSSSSDSTRSVDEVKVERGKGKVKAEVDDTSALLDDANLLDPFKQGAQMYESTGGIVQPGDVNWDSSFIGNYDPVEMPFPGPETAEMAVTAVIDVAENTSKSMNAATGIARWGAMGSGPMLATPNFLLPWFPTAEERSLILHYCANAADLMMAIPSGLNPMLAINLPLALDSPRGMNPSADALRVTLLGIGAVHQAFLLARSGMSTPQTAAMFQYASNLRDTAKEMVRRAVLEGGGAKSDAALGAGTALATIDIFFGGGGWLENFSLAKDMVAFRGGPAEMLKASQPTQLAEGVTVSPARLMLEILTIYETFGCLTTGQEPTLISDKWEDWWYVGSRSTYEEHSVEKQFGMSRVMVHLFSRLARLLSRVSRCSTIITESDSPTDNMMLSSVVPMNTGVIDPLLPISSLISSMINPTNSSATDAALIAEARLLNSDVDAWIESLQLSTLEHERVQIGNRAYAYAMKILLLRRVFKYPRQDLRVQNAATRVLEHCSTSTALLGMSIDLTWPAIIAGCCVEPASRPMVLVLLELFKRQCCFDIETACTIIQEVWRRIDVGEPRADWKEVCDDLNLQVL